MYKIHNFTVLDYETIIYRPLDRKFFVEFGFTTTTGPSLIRAELFDRYVFAFVPFGSLTDRYGVKTYLTGDNIIMFIWIFIFFPDAIILIFFFIFLF